MTTLAIIGSIIGLIILGFCVKDAYQCCFSKKDVLINIIVIIGAIALVKYVNWSIDYLITLL